jgi:hypothetical protein
MASIMHNSDQVVELSTTGDIYEQDRMAIESVVFAGTPGAFSFRAGAVTYVVTTTANCPVVTIPLRRTANVVEGVTVPASGKIYVLLENKM